MIKVKLLCTKLGREGEVHYGLEYLYCYPDCPTTGSYRDPTKGPTESHMLGSKGIRCF
jgi:hypothetical protein